MLVDMDVRVELVADEVSVDVLVELVDVVMAEDVPVPEPEPPQVPHSLASAAASAAHCVGGVAVYWAALAGFVVLTSWVMVP